MKVTRRQYADLYGPTVGPNISAYWRRESFRDMAELD